MQNHLIAAVGEFVGTFFFLYFAYSGTLMAKEHAFPRPPPEGPAVSAQTVVFIAIAYGFSLLVNVWAFYRISGGLFNPAVLFGLCLSGQLSWLRGAFLLPAQLLACMCAGGLVSCMFPGNIADANSTLSSGATITQGVFLEMFFTAQLVFVVLMLAVEKSRDTFMAPVGIGLTLFVVMVAGTPYTSASLNPARSFGCAVASRTFPGYHWIYWIGPALGAALAAGFYRIMKWAHYEQANPGQDSPHPDLP